MRDVERRNKMLKIKVNIKLKDSFSKVITDFYRIIMSNNGISEAVANELFKDIVDKLIEECAEIEIVTDN